MKSPNDLKQLLRRQWNHPKLRVSRLLGGGSEWPISLPIGKPTHRQLTHHLDDVKQHMAQWRAVNVGEVVWSERKYRSLATTISIPTAWVLKRPTEWIEATDCATTRSEFELLTELVSQSDPILHGALVKRRSLWRARPREDLLKTMSLAGVLTPGCAQGNPLRMLGGTIQADGIDTKFFERNGPFLIALLDARFDGQCSSVGLEAFLQASTDGEHWLLLVDLDGSLLPYRTMRVRSCDLRERALPGKRLLLVENETCQVHLPDLPGTIAVLGTGFDLKWLQNDWVQERVVGYWGDIDTWGLQFLAKARTYVPGLVPLLMTEAIFNEYQQNAVPEPTPALKSPVAGLTAQEQQLYDRLLASPRGRLEQEFLPIPICHQSLKSWPSVG